VACVVDNGLFIGLAQAISKDFKKVYYTSPWVCAFPTTNTMSIGSHVPGIERIDEFWSRIDEIDLFIYPDIYTGAEQRYLQSIGKRVWGSRYGEDLEIEREEAKLHLKQLGCNIGPYKVIKGLDDLRHHLKYNDRQFVKISKTRGDGETFFAKNYANIETRLDELEHSLGAAKKHIETGPQYYSYSMRIIPIFYDRSCCTFKSLYNRSQYEFNLKEFNLFETKQFLKNYYFCPLQIRVLKQE
jgi:hypothetical protein